MANPEDRRAFVKTLVGAGAAASALAASAMDAEAQERRRPTGALPERGEFVIRNAYVLTMDPELGDIPDGDVHVKKGQIVGVGKDISAPGARTIDGRHTIVLPGLVDTH